MRPGLPCVPRLARSTQGPFSAACITSTSVPAEHRHFFCAPTTCTPSSRRARASDALAIRGLVQWRPWSSGSQLFPRFRAGFPGSRSWARQVSSLCSRWARSPLWKWPRTSRWHGSWEIRHPRRRAPRRERPWERWSRRWPRWLSQYPQSPSPAQRCRLPQTSRHGRQRHRHRRRWLDRGRYQHVQLRRRQLRHPDHSPRRCRRRQRVPRPPACQ